MDVDLIPDPFVRDQFRIVADGKLTNQLCDFGWSTGPVTEVSPKQLVKEAKSAARSKKIQRGVSSHVSDFYCPALPLFAPDWMASELDGAPWTEFDWSGDPASGREVVTTASLVQVRLDGQRTGSDRSGGHVIIDPDRFHVIVATPPAPTTETNSVRDTAFVADKVKRKVLEGLLATVSVVADPEGAFEALEGLGNRAKPAPPEAIAQTKGWAANARRVGGLSIPWRHVNQMNISTDFTRVFMTLVCDGIAPRFNFQSTIIFEVGGTPTQQGLENLVHRIRGLSCPPIKKVGWIERNESVASLGMILDEDQEPYRPPQLWEYAK